MDVTGGLSTLDGIMREECESRESTRHAPATGNIRSRCHPKADTHAYTRIKSTGKILEASKQCVAVKIGPNPILLERGRNKDSLSSPSGPVSHLSPQTDVTGDGGPEKGSAAHGAARVQPHPGPGHAGANRRSG